MDMTREERLAKIMGAPDSPTGKLVALRQTPPATGDLTPGVWYSNFTRVKEEAERRGLPFIGMWTNGDLCGFCRRFTGNLLEEPFAAFVRGSKEILYWLGGSFDDNPEDGMGGKGFRWLRGPEGKVSYYPFFAVYRKRNGVEEYAHFGSGHDYDERKAAPHGTPNILIKIHNIMHPDRPVIVPTVKTDGTIVKSPTPSVTSPTAAQTAVSGRLSIRVNPDWDDAHIMRFREALAKTGGHCPCRPERTPDTKCMCKTFLDQTTPGPCHCGAYEKYMV